MLSKSEAVSLALDEIRRIETPDLPFVIIENSTIERPLFWVFFYNTKKYIETQEIIYQLAGNGPIFVNKNTGVVMLTGSDKPLRILLDDYEQSIEE